MGPRLSRAQSKIAETGMSKSAEIKPRTRAATGVYAVFRGDDGGTQPIRVQFWEEQADGSWAGMVAGATALEDARSFNNFVRFENRVGSARRG